MPQPIELRFDAVCAGYAGARVLNNVDMCLREGRKLGLIGRNGAGKTTTLACAMGLAQLQAGRVTLGDEDASAWPVYRRARKGVGYVPQSRDIFPSLSVEENLLSALQGRPRSQALDAAYELFPRLYERRRNGGMQLSGGEQQMLSIARALVPQPRLLLLDEPLEGLAPKVREELMAVIERMVRLTGVGCMLVEQQVDLVLDFADDVMVLERGVIAFNGDAASLRRSPDVLNRAIGLERA